MRRQKSLWVALMRGLRGIAMRPCSAFVCDGVRAIAIAIALVCLVAKMGIVPAFADAPHSVAGEAGGDATDGEKAKYVCNGQCSDSAPAVDPRIAMKYAALRAAYKGRQMQSLEAGQTRWLKLRGEACAIGTRAAEHFVQCLRAVDDERVRELDELKEIVEEEAKAGVPLVDLEGLLDSPINLAAYSPAAMSSVYFDDDRQASRIPSNCRELYTLTAGAWQYGDDTTGTNSRGAAFEACQMMLFGAQARAPQKRTQIDFNDIEGYASAMMCFAVRCGDSDFALADPRESFGALQKAGKLKIESGHLPANGSDACNGTLVVDPPFFCLAGENARLDVSKPADYTGGGEQQALVRVLFFPTQGTQRLHYAFVAFYDPKARSIRVREIDENSRIKLIFAKEQD